MKENKLFKRLVIFAIAAFMCLGAISAVNAEIGTSTITAVTTEYTPGTTSVDLEFQLDCYSADYEYVVYVELDFPTGVTVNSAEDIGSLNWANPTGETGDGVMTTWGDPSLTYTYGYLYNEINNFKVNVDIDSGFTSPMVIDWFMSGDIYGAIPHTVSGTVTLTEGAPDYCYFDDDFSAGFANWQVNGAGPQIVTTTNAGGTSPECRFYWSPLVDGDYIMSNPEDTSAETDLWMSFRSMINHYSSSYPYNLFVEVTGDGSTWSDVTPWSNPIDADYAAARYLLNVPEAIGTQTSVRFRFTGDDFGLNYWYLDDVKICDFITLVDGAVLSIIQPTDYSDGLVPVQTRVANQGNTPQTADVNVQISHEVGGGVLYFEDFDSAWGPQGDNPPAGWQIFDMSAGTDGIWNNNDWYRYTSYGGCARIYYSPYTGDDDGDDWLVSPSVNCLGESIIHMTIGYLYEYMSSSSGTNIHAYIEGSTDGGMTFPHAIDDWDYLGNPASPREWDISSWAANEPDVKIRFRWISPGTGYRYGYMYFNDFTIVAPTTTVMDYDQTKSVSFAAGEQKTVLMPDFIVPVGDDYTITSTITIAGDEDPSNDQVVEFRPLGNVDVEINSIDVPAYSTIGPIDFNPEVTVTQNTNSPMLSVPVTYAIYEQPFTSAWETKFTEDFEGFMSPNVVTQDMVKGIETHVTDEHEGSVVEATINWLDEPNLGMPEQWTVIDNDWDDVTWHPSDTRVASGDVSMYMGDPDTDLYPLNSYDWLISPPINAGDACQVTFDLWHGVEYGYDYVIVFWSADGTSWTGFWLPDHFFWNTWTLTCPDPSFIDDTGTCYVAFVFSSDSSVAYEGPYLDNVEIKGSASLYSETVDVVLDGAVTQSVTFPAVSGVLDFDKDYVVQAAVQHPQDNVPVNDELDLAFDTFVQVYNTRNGKAFTTIQAAIDDADTLDGDTIVARDGNYNEDINIYKDLTVTGENPPTSTAIIYGTVDIVADGVTFQNFKVIPGGLFTADEAGIFIAAGNVIVQDNIIEGMTGEVTDTMFTIKGIHVYGGGPEEIRNIVIQNNIIRNIVNTNLTGGGGGGDTVFWSEDFEGGIPGTWTLLDLDMNGYDWTDTNPGGRVPPPGSNCVGTFAICDEDSWWAEPDDNWMITDNIDCTGQTGVKLSFGSYFKSYSSYDQLGEVFVNGHNVYAIMGGDDYAQTDIDISAYADNNPNVVIEFHFLTTQWSYYWMVDNIELSSTIGPTVYTYGGADGIMVQGYVKNVDILDNTITDIHSAGWCYGVEVTPTASAVFGGSFADVFYESDFESDDGGWVATASWDPVGDWEWTDSYDYSLYTLTHSPPTAAYSGDGLWGTVVHGDYTNSGGFNYLSQTFDFTGLEGITLSWYEWVDVFGNFDYGEVFVNGDQVYYVDTYGAVSWDLVTIDLSAYEDLASVEIEFSLYCTTVVEYAGWYIDDILIEVESGMAPPQPQPQKIDVIGNYFKQIGDGSVYDVWDSGLAPYPGVMFTLDETYPGADDGDANEVELHANIFDNDCSIPILAVINKDTDGLLDAETNYWGNILGPGSYAGPVYDAITGDLADADDFSCSIVNLGPVHFMPFVGIDAVATISSLSVETGEAITFDASDSLAADFDGVYTPVYYWTFGDGFHSEEEIIGHSYGSPGTYTGYLRVQGQGLGPVWPNFMYDWAHFTITVIAPGAPLAANADGGNLGGYETVASETLSLYGVASGGKAPYVFYWDFGNGETVITEGQEVTTTYKYEGVYTATLTVSDMNGDTATDTAQVNVIARDEIIASACGPYVGMIDVPVYFQSDVTGGVGPYTYTWNLGDGTVSTDENPTHTYDEAGAYTVTLTVEDNLGGIDTDTTIVTVEVEEDGAIIGEIQGGLGVKTTITAGNEPVDWTISVDGRVFIGGAASGSISAGSTESVRLPFSLGFGNVDITITANSITKECTAFMIGPFVLVK